MATYDLTIIQGQRLWRAFRYKIDDVAQALTGYSWRAEVRQKENPTSLRLLDLTSYLALDPDDNTRLVLDAPASVTAALDAKQFKETSSWDLFLWPTADPGKAFLFVEGLAVINPAATDMREA